MRRRLIVGVTGASGSILALAVLRQLAAADVETNLVISDGARPTVVHELGAGGIGQFTTLVQAADVKEKRRLVIAPPAPPFYTRPSCMDDIVREIAARLLNRACVDPGESTTRWSGAL